MLHVSGGITTNRNDWGLERDRSDQTNDYRYSASATQSNAGFRCCVRRSYIYYKYELQCRKLSVLNRATLVLLHAHTKWTITPDFSFYNLIPKRVSLLV